MTACTAMQSRVQAARLNLVAPLAATLLLAASAKILGSVTLFAADRAVLDGKAGR